MQLFLKTHSEMANSLDPDQTVPSGSILFAYDNLLATFVYEILQHFSSVIRSCEWEGSPSSFLFPYTLKTFFHIMLGPTNLLLCPHYFHWEWGHVVSPLSVRT